MSIYLEFPTIEQYPLYTDPFKNDEQLFHPEEVADVAWLTEQHQLLKQYLTFLPYQ